MYDSLISTICYLQICLKNSLFFTNCDKNVRDTDIVTTIHELIKPATSKSRKQFMPSSYSPLYYNLLYKYWPENDIA